MEEKEKKAESVEPKKDGTCPSCGEKLFRGKCFKCGITIES